MKSATSFVLLAALALAGCSNFPVAQYAPSDQNREALLKIGTQQTVGIKALTATMPKLDKIKCRGAGHLVFPAGETANQYLTGALRKELSYANLYAENGAIQISGNVKYFDMNSNVLNAGWQFDVTVTNGTQSFDVQYLHRVKTAWAADRACAAVAAQLVDAVQAFNQKIVTNAAFVAWLKPAER